jgi:hypothetical protein
VPRPDKGCREGIGRNPGAVPKKEKVLEDSAVQPLTHLASSTVRTFEFVHEGGKTEVPLSSETVDDMKSYANLLSLACGELKLSKAEPHPTFVRELAAIIS